MSTPGRHRDATGTSRWLGLGLALVLATAQVLLADHRVGHVDTLDHADCPLCLAAGSLDHAAAGTAADATAATAAALPPAPPSLQTITTHPRRANARAPPPPHA